MKTHLRAFTITEMLVVLSIMPIFMLISTQLFRGIMITADTTQLQLAAKATFDAATAQMWRDLFRAADVRSISAGTILVTERDGKMIRWQTRNTHLLRTAADQRTFNIPHDLRMKIMLQNHDVVLQLIGPQGCEDQASCTPPASFWSPS